MANRIILPKLGTNIDKATIVRWLKREGEKVSKGDILLELETEKATFEVEAEYNGTLRKIFYPEGSQVGITRTIAILAGPDEDISGLEKEIEQENKQPERAYTQQTYKEWLEGDGRIRPEPPAEIRMSPAAKRLVQQENIDIHSLASHFQGKKEVLELQDVKTFGKAEKVIIYGAGLGAKQALEIIRQLPHLEVMGMVDDDYKLKDKVIHNYRVVGGFEELKEGFDRGEFSSIVLSFHSEVRRKVFLKLKKTMPGIPIKTLIDPRAVVSDDVEIGEGVFIEAGVVVGPGVRIGDGVIIDLGVVVCHDCYIGAHSHLSPGCSLSGVVCLRENVLVGVGSSVNSTVTVGKNVIITLGSAVMNDVEDDVIVSGIPAAVIGESRRGK